VEKFNISFSGETLPDHDRETVKKRFAKAFKLTDRKRLEAIFSGQPVVLKKGLSKDEAARYYGTLRKIGAVCHIKKIGVPAPTAKQVSKKPAAKAAAAQPRPRPEPKPKVEPETEQVVLESPPEPDSQARRRRQPGAPNIFDLRLSDRAGKSSEESEKSSHVVRAPIIAAAIMLLAFALVGLRFWAESSVNPSSGLGGIAVDDRQQPVVGVSDKLLFHDRAGVATDTVVLSEFGVNEGAPFDFFSNGDLLVLKTDQLSSAPAWLHPILGVEESEGGKLLRCVLETRSCTELLSDLGPVAFLVERRTDTIYLADAEADTLRKLDAAAKVVGNKAIELTAPLHLVLQEGILYLTQSGSDAVQVLKPDDRDFGMELDKFSLEVDDASQSGHIFPGDLAWLNEQWWTIMQSRDGNNAGVYRFSARWKYEDALALSEDAHPGALTRWGAKMLISDFRQEKIYRFDAAAREEKPFSSGTINDNLGDRQSQISLSRSLQVAVLLILFIASAGLMALGVLQSLRHKVYKPPMDSGEPGFDINDENILWLDPEPGTDEKLRKLGLGIAGGATFILLVAFILQLSIWWMIALCIVLAGLGGYYFALQKTSHGHIGLQGDNLILVDHTNTYRVGAGPSIQYFDNYIMIDDVIVSLGNPLLRAFADEPLQETFKPVVSRGIRVDRATVQVKMIQNRHPLAAGLSGMVFAVICAALLIIFS
jgi:hypothetical protein